jgi:uncharacterized YccA/Bax inhibitor family protein
MQSSNPVFRRSEGFNGPGGAGTQRYAGNGISYPAYGAPSTPPPGYGNPSAWGSGQQTQPGQYTGVPVDQGRMTIDSVIQKTGITMAVVVVVAALTWVLTGDISAGAPGADTRIGTLYLLSMVGAFGGFALAMVNSFKRIVSPALVLGYAADGRPRLRM